jgi:hypothetical protein
VADAEDPLTDDVVAGAVESIPVVGPILAPFFKRGSRRIREEWARNTSKALRAAERASGMTREQLADVISEDPRLIPLVTRVLFAAGMTGQDSILRALGTALGDAAREPDKLDEAELLLIGMTDLRRHHVVLLEIMSDDPPQPDRPGGGFVHWHASLLAEKSGYSSDVVTICIAGLLNSGLIRALDDTYGASYEISDLGRTALAVVDELDEK